MLSQQTGHSQKGMLSQQIGSEDSAYDAGTIILHPAGGVKIIIKKVKICA